MSSIYDWYERADIKETEKLEKDVELITYYYKCKVCLEKMKEEQLSKYKGITASRKANSNLHKHLKIDCALHQKAKLEYDTLNEKAKNKNLTITSVKRKLIEEENKNDTTTPKRTLLNMNAVSQTPKYPRNGSMQVERFRQLLLMLIKCMLPISLVERQPFRDFVGKLDPSFHVPTRYVVKHTGLPNLREEIKSKLKNIMKTIPWPNVSLDGWSDGILRCFNGYVVQGISENWTLIKHSLAFKNSKGRILNI
jgi:hypothetical protein